MKITTVDWLPVGLGVFCILVVTAFSSTPAAQYSAAQPAVAAAEIGSDAPQVTGKVYETTLDNGLKVLVKIDRRAPIVTSQVWYKVGSSDEHGGITGISHMLEHMMFKGSERLAPGEFSRIIAAQGGEENAFTGRDYTAYFQTLAADRLAIALELEAERMGHLALPPEEYVKELEVVKEERRLRTDDNPEALTFEQFNAVAYVASPYRIPIIGWAGDLESMTLDDVRTWYQRWYAPNNATLVVVGDVDPNTVFALAERTFGSLPAVSLTPTKPQPEPRQLGEKRLRVQTPAKSPYLLFGYKVPTLGETPDSWEPYALEMLAAVLDGGSSARFRRELIRNQRVAASANARYNAVVRLPGMILFSGIPAQEQTIAALEAAMLTEIERLRTEPVTETELERIRTQLIAEKVYEQDSVFYQAMVLGQFETVGIGWQRAESYVDQLAAITAQQIQQVANTYLIPEHRTRAVLDPLPLDEAAAAQLRSGEFVHVR